MFPDARREARLWHARAREIPDSTLRRLALDAHREKGRNLEGATAFAAFAPPAGRHAAIRAAVAYQTLFDYLDNLSEEPSEDPLANGRLLNSALPAAVSPDQPHSDYYALRGSDDDGGYLRELIATCRTALTALPSFTTIAGPVRAASERIAVYQSLNHGDGDGRHDSFERWARDLGKAHTRLRWWETGAAAGSTLDLLALIAAAADPTLDRSVAIALGSAYFPWVDALHSLLDSLVDHHDDLATGKRGLIDYYSSSGEIAERVTTIAGEAMHQAGEMSAGHSHTLIVAAMTSFYLCDLSLSSSPHAHLAAPAVLDTMGCLARPTMLILETRQSVGRVADAIGGYTPIREVWRQATHPDRRRMLESVRGRS